MKICIVGAGAIGGYLAVMLKKSGFQVSIVARGPHLEAIKKNGLKLVTSVEEYTVQLDASETVPDQAQDYAFVTVKATALESLSTGLKKLSDNGATIIPAINGLPHWYFFQIGNKWENTYLKSLDPKRIFEKAVPFKSIIGTIVYPACEIVEPGIVKHISETRFSLGEPSGEKTSRVLNLSKILTDSGLKAPVSKRIRDEIWIKLWGNVAFNPISALTGATLEEICGNKETRSIAENIMKESKKIGEAIGVKFPISIEKRIAGAAAVGNHKTSMLQDLEAGRNLEIDAIISSVKELGELVKVDTPTIDCVLGLVKQRAYLVGSFEYSNLKDSLKN